MRNLLAKICEVKREHVAQRKTVLAEARLLDDIKHCPPVRGFAKALVQPGVRLIAELKKASPSRGLIRADFDPASLAVAYEAGGAACLSVLTDMPYFLGDDAYLAAARNAVRLPVLRKDFMLDPYQILESRALGADAVLLIMAALEDMQAKELEKTALDLNMDVLVEVHDEQELERALMHLTSPLIGINNRNLKTLEVDLAIAAKLVKSIPSGRIPVCESGIHTALDIKRMGKSGIHCFLVGESLMRQNDVTLATRTLLGAFR